MIFCRIEKIQNGTNKEVGTSDALGLTHRPPVWQMSPVLLFFEGFPKALNMDLDLPMFEISIFS